MSNWISVEERLPDDKQKIIVKGVCSSSMNGATVEETRLFIIRANGSSNIHTSSVKSTHWKPA